jgi:hypothetical protein
MIHKASDTPEDSPGEADQQEYLCEQAPGHFEKLPCTRPKVEASPG